MLGRTVGEQVLEKGPSVVFAGVQSVLDAADLRLANLECALTDSDTAEHKSYTLKAPPAAAAALGVGKFDVVSLANNHAMDYGFQGLQETQRALSQAGVASLGAGANFEQAHTPVILHRNGLRLAFLAYMDVPVERDGFDARDWIATASRPGIAWANPGQITADVAAARLKADVVIVLLHSGIEIAQYMSIVTGDQRLEAHAAIDAGAALVVGSHPHQLESIEAYHGGLIAYSLGNFVFDDYRGIANASIILQVTLTRSGFQSYEYVPVLIDNGLPHVITADLAPAIGTLVAPVTP
jgi:poly-gamma-glutamate synthesis protein (capsule biosynthesis protein)